MMDPAMDRTRPAATASPAGAVLLELDHVDAGYGDAIVLEQLSLRIEAGRSLAVLGRNGVGKTTLLETIVGNTRLMGGALRWQGRDITSMAPNQRARGGIGWVPQEREAFPSLTVQENLTVVACPGPWTLARVYDLFPRLQERRRNFGNELSGGEQQMLVIARALMTNPKLLLLDEPMEGLAPIVVEELSAAIRRLHDEEGLTSIVVEQHPIIALAMTQDVIVLERGQIIHHAPSAELARDGEALDRLLGVTA